MYEVTTFIISAEFQLLGYYGGEIKKTVNGGTRRKHIRYKK
jgi:hypothetical protein